MYKKLFHNLGENDVFLITSPHNLMYLTGFTGGEGIAVIGKNLKVLITDFRYIEAAEKETKDFKVINSVPYISVLKEIFYINNVSTVYYEDNYITHGQFKKIEEMSGEFVKFKAASSDLEKLRIIKNEFELNCIKKAESIASDTFNYVLGKIKDGMTEIEVAAEIEYFMKKNGGQKTSFDTIVISGKKTSLPHGIPSEKKICYGDFITMDYGCVYNGYCSDITRTVVLGKASKKQKEIYNIVLDAQLYALDFLSTEKSSKEADKVARDIIERAGYGKYFGHSLGHGVGLLIHELPNLSPKSEVILEENMVVSCEPGIYIPNFGGVRIEDLVVIKKHGIENLTYAEKKFIEI